MKAAQLIGGKGRRRELWKKWEEYGVWFLGFIINFAFMFYLFIYFPLGLVNYSKFIGPQ